MLELIKAWRVAAEQAEPFAEITLALVLPAADRRLKRDRSTPERHFP